ncbi:MAG: nucleotidyltransferase domain-containing protein [Nanoarchaeota archaeon]
MDKKENKELKKFINAMVREFGPCEIILFGSKANGMDWKKSDFDIIIVSDKFQGVKWLQRISKIVQHWKMDKDLDVLPYTREEFEYKKKNYSFIREALVKSVLLNKISK